MCKKRRKFLEIDQAIVVGIYHPECLRQFTLTSFLASHTFSKLKLSNHVNIDVVHRYEAIVIRIKSFENYFL